jgi:hypothetical protein
MIAKLFVGGAIAAAAISTAAPTPADPGTPFSHLCMDSQCSTPAPASVSHSDTSRVQAGIQQGLHDMQSALSTGRRPS